MKHGSNTDKGGFKTISKIRVSSVFHPCSIRGEIRLSIGRNDDLCLFVFRAGDVELAVGPLELALEIS